jgi:hypothetical protein
MRVPAAIVLAVAGFFAASCGGITDPSKNTVEPFSGTLAVGGNFAHPFTASKTGEISVKVTALAPVSNTFVGIIWAQAAGDGSCSTSLGILQQNNFAQLNVPAISGAIISGRYCIVVYDVGAFTTPQTYTISVSHP